MINPKELRIGVTIEGRWDDEKNIITLDKMYLVEALNYPDIFYGIPITEEWLINSEFEKGVGDYYSTGITWRHKSGITIFEHGDNIYSLYRYNDFRVIIKYIHHLQNIIFALTGE